MRLQPLNPDFMTEHRPGKGDTVVCRGSDELYVVKEVGLKYLVCYLVDNPLATRWLKAIDCMKYTPPDPNDKYDVLEEFPGLSKRR